jgi:hypothetical protein
VSHSAVTHYKESQTPRWLSTSKIAALVNFLLGLFMEI